MDQPEAARRYCGCGTRLARDNRETQCGRCQRKARELTSGAPDVPSGFWLASDQLRDALASWHMGRVIAAYRTHPHHAPPLSQEVVAGWVGLTQTQLSRIEAGPPITDLTKLIRWAKVLRIPEALLWFKLPGARTEVPEDIGSDRSPALTLAYLEQLRRRATTTLTTQAMTGASLDDWEQTVIAYGRATRYQSAGVLLADLAADFAELQEALARRQPAVATLRLTRLTARMAGLISLTLIKLGEAGPARAWGRTARLAAFEAGDPATSAWVRAQDAYTFFYSGLTREALAEAAEAQALAGNTPCVGAVLAAALEARAHGVLGHTQDANAALDQAEVLLAALTPDDITASAFGYNEAQLRFHQGNALTHLGDTARAQEAHARALALYPASDYLDRALIQLDQAACLARDGNLDAGVTHAARTLEGLPPHQRDRLILERARGLAQAASPTARALPALDQLRGVLELPPGSVRGGA